MLYLVFHLAGQRYALPAVEVVEVLPLVEVRPLPQAPPGVMGVFNRRGALLPLLDLKVLTLGTSSNSWLSSRILLVEDEPAGHRFGLLVERATGTVQLDPAAFEVATVESPTAPYLGAVITDQHGSLQKIHLRKILTDQMRAHLFGTAGSEVQI